MPHTHSPDEPPLTAYLLGELSPAEVAQLDEQLAASVALREELDGLRGTIATLQSAFAQQSDTQPAVPAINRDKLHSLLRSAVVTPAIEASTAAPLLLASGTRSAESRPVRSRGLMVGGAVAIVLGLVGLSQFETGSTPKAGPSVAVSNRSGKAASTRSTVVLHDGAKSPANTERGLLTDALAARDIAANLSSDALVATPSEQNQKLAEPQVQLQFAPLDSSLFMSTASSPRPAFVRVQSGKTSSRRALSTQLWDMHSVQGRGQVPAGLTSQPVTNWGFENNSNALVEYHPITSSQETFWGDRVNVVGNGTVEGFNIADHFSLVDLPRRRIELGRRIQQNIVLPGLLDQNDNGILTPRILVESKETPFLGFGTNPGASVAFSLDYDGSPLPVAPTSEVAQLRTAVENLQQLVASNGNERVNSYGREARFGDLSEQLSEQRKTLEAIELKLAEPQAPGQATESSPAHRNLDLLESESLGDSEQTLALAKAREEVQRAYSAWYYREGRIRQARESIAAAESYAHVPENDFVTPDAQPLSTFGIDVDSASYANVRRFVESNQLPPPDAVRIEELVNSFKYDGPTIAEGEAPLALAAEVGICPWQPQHQLLRVALKGKSIDLEKRPAARLVFLVDTSGSMSDANKLPLVKQSLRLLVEQMREQDRLSIVTYSDGAGLLLDSTGGDKREEILAKIDALVSDGSTNGEAGLKLAYEVAVKQFAEGATNRVMLCTDGDFNVGESSDSAMVKLIEKERQTGVFLNIFGFGSGNLKDAKLEAIADKGNGQYLYIDGIKEARKTLLNELTGTLYTIAKDVKLQIEFNPALVGSYRLVGYENRVMAAQDFANDKVDSGDLGAGHSVVALYEIIPPGVAAAPKPEAEPLKYPRAGSVSVPSETTAPADPLASELCTIRLRYKQPTSNESTKIETAVSLPTEPKPLTKDYLWATAVAEFGLVLRHSSFVGSGNFSQVLELAQSALGDDPTGQRREFLTLVRQTQHLEHQREAQIAELSKLVREDEQLVQRRDAAAQNAELMAKASCSGKYKTLLRQLEVPGDQAAYGDFKDYGRWDETDYQSFKNLPPGYWVYMAPHWYIWNETTEQAAMPPAK